LVLRHYHEGPARGVSPDRLRYRPSPAICNKSFPTGSTGQTLHERIEIMPRMSGDEEAFSNYQHGVAPRETPEGRTDRPPWQPEERGTAAVARHSAQPERFPETPVAGSVAKNAVLYAILGLLIPGLPSLLIRDDKVIGGIQLGLWVLSWILTFVLIGFLLWPAVAIWSAVTGYGDAQLWNRRHGYVT
jgi:hypothetical protein